MKKFILLMMLPFYALVTMAQDMLVTNEGKSMTIYNLEISDQSIFFQLQDKADAPLQKMLKKDVLIIKKADGTKLDLNAPQTEAPSQVSQPTTQEESGTVNITPETLSPEAKAANDALIAKYNQPVKFSFKKEKNKDKIKEAKDVIAILGIKENSILSNEDIEINITMGSMHKPNKKTPAEFSRISEKELTWLNPALLFSVKNKTNRTLYLDLGNTFYISMGQSCCFYVPSSTTTSASSSSGGSLNLGAVAGALGVGGVAGTLANGVNVGGSSTNGTSSTTYAQRIVAIAPLATLNLVPQYMFGNEIRDLCQGMRYDLYDIFCSYNFETSIYFSDDNKMLTGEHISYSESSSPVNCSFVLTYSDTEDCRMTKSQSAHIYLKDLGGFRFGLTGSDIRFDFDNHPLRMTMVIKTAENGKSFPKK